MRQPAIRICRSHGRYTLRFCAHDSSRLLARPLRSISCRLLYSGAQGQATSRVRHTRVEVPCRGDGLVPLDIFRPSSSGVTARQQLQPLLIYLPSGDHGPSDFASILSMTSQSTVVQLNYRLSTSRPFPLPIHDVLAGYDWVVKNAKDLVQGETGSRSIGMGTCGAMTGGTLATMLALTECRRDSEIRVVAAAVKEAIVDWVNLDNPMPAGSRSTTSKSKAAQVNADSTMRSLTHEDLLALRGAAFRADRPGSYFDPFASPLLFLRSPGATVPHITPSKSPGDEWSVLAGLEELSIRDDGTSRSTVDPQAIEDLLQKPSSPSDASTASEPPLRARKMPKPYPVRGNPPLVFPTFKFIVGQRSPLRGQTEEMVRLLRRNLVKHGDGEMKGMAGVKDELSEKGEDAEDSEEIATALKAADDRFQIELSDMPGGFLRDPQDDYFERSKDSMMQRDDAEALGYYFRNVICR